jgi:putative ABC transport system permease protein
LRLERWLYTMPLRLRSLFRSRHVERDLDDELRDHLERLIAERITKGLSPEEARYAALRAMGGVDQSKENCRDARRVHVVDDVIKDLRYGLRTLRRTPGFTAAAILSLALGIGANTAIFSVVDAVLLKPLAYGNPDRLVVVREGGSDTVAPATFLGWRAAGNRSFERIGAAEYWTPNLTGVDRTDRLFALHLSTEVLPLLGVEPMLGRVFRPDEEHSGHEHVVVISYNLWKNRFASNEGVIGGAITLDGEAFTIVGVMPQSFRFAPFWATKAELWAPLVLDARKADTGASLRIFARLNPDVTVARARAEMTALEAALDRNSGTRPQVSVTPLHERVVGDVRSALLILLAATVFVLLIACANVAHLQLVRAATREREIALRTALGASRARVVRQLLTESAMLCAAGAAAGLLLGYAGVHLLVSLAPPNLPRVESVVLDARAFAFMLCVTVCAGVIFGLAPALKGSRVDVHDSLKDGGRSSSGDGRARLRSILVVSEFAMAMVLLAGAGLILRSFVGLFAVDSGFDPRSVVAMVVSVTGTQEADPSRRPVFFQDLLARVRSLPDVQQASAINHLPLVGDIWGFPFAIEGRPLPRPEDVPVATYRVVLPAYFQTMRIPVIKGRDFTDRDVIASPHVVVINDFMARRYWPNRDPVGERVAAGDVERPEWCTIVGVVKTVKQSAWTDPDREELYFPYLQTRLYLENPRSFATYMTVVARTSSSPTALIASAQGVVRSMDHRVVVTDAMSMEHAIAGEFTAPRFYTLLIGIFAGVALLLAAVGIYGVISHSVTRRTQEIGVRMALGAGRADIFKLVLSHGMRLGLSGSLLGLLCAVGLTRYLRTLLFGVEPGDPATFALVGLLLGVVALIACYIPARRAVGVDPMTAVRCE